MNLCLKTNISVSFDIELVIKHMRQCYDMQEGNMELVMEQPSDGIIVICSNIHLTECQGCGFGWGVRTSSIIYLACFSCVCTFETSPHKVYSLCYGRTYWSYCTVHISFMSSGETDGTISSKFWHSLIGVCAPSFKLIKSQVKGLAIWKTSIQMKPV